MGFVLVEDLDGVPVSSHIHHLEHISARLQDMDADARNLDWVAEGYNSFSVPRVGLGFRRGEYTESGKAQSCSQAFEQCHSFLQYFRLTRTAVVMRPLYVVGFTRVRTPETPAAFDPWRVLNVSISYR